MFILNVNWNYNCIQFPEMCTIFIFRIVEDVLMFVNAWYVICKVAKIIRYLDDYWTAIEVKVELKNGVNTMSFFSGCHYSYGHTRSIWQWKYGAGLCHCVCIEHDAEFCPDLQSLAPHTGGWFAASSGNWIVNSWRDQGISLAV